MGAARAKRRGPRGDRDLGRRRLCDQAKVVLDPAALKPVTEVTGPWEVAFEPNRGAPASAKFDKLISWPEHSDPGIKYFSGVATYRTKLDVPAAVAGDVGPDVAAAMVWRGWRRA
jgi:hypothetical protein